MPDLLEEQRENWGTRAAFVLAAIGSAVGLGNLWAFPYKLYGHGGGAFLIPYILAMVVVGIPLLIAEFSLGHLTQRATPDAFGRADRKFAFVGWWQIILSFIIITYYAVILAYCVSFLYYSVVGIFNGGDLPWAGEGIEGVQNAKTFFFDDFLGHNESFTLGRVQWHIVGALVVTWVAMYLCIFRGVKLVSKVVLWTVPLPWLLLGILTIRGLTLPGAVVGLEYYLEPNWSRLANPETWRWAFGQMFFSMSLAFGIMITYASFLHRKSDLNNNAAIIGLADLGTSFVAGLAVFATLGGMAYASAMHGTGVPVDKVAEGGASLAFVAFPYALAQLPHSAWFSLFFFGSLLLLGIDSAFSITECVLASIVDKTGWSRDKVLIALSLVGLAIGLLYCTAGGLTWLGKMDDFINGTWGITLTALLECVVLGWLFQLRRLRGHANERSDWKIGRWWEWAIRLVIPVLLGALFAWSLFDSLAAPDGYANRHESGPVAVEVPAAEKLPDRPILEARFVADFNGEAEHAAALDDAKDEKKDTHKGWTIRGATDAPLAETFKAADLIGQPLRYTTEKLKPRTAYTAEYRWYSRPEVDPVTGLPIAVPEDQQPAWQHLGTMRTGSRRAGIHIGNTVALGIMALAPVLAIGIGAVRVKRRAPEPLPPGKRAHHPSPVGPWPGRLALVMCVHAVVLLAVAGKQMLDVAAALRAGHPTEAALTGPFGLPPGILPLLGAAVAAVTALASSWPILTAWEKHNQRPTRAARLGGAGGIVGIGLAIGLMLAYVMILRPVRITPTAYDAHLSGWSYLLLSCMLGLIVIGLGWCFYRALKAAGGETAAQLAEDIEE